MNITALTGESNQKRLIFGVGLSWLFDAMDVGIISFIAAALAVEWSLGAQQVGLLTAINSIGMAAGAAFAGSLADKYGRRSVLLWTLLMIGAAAVMFFGKETKGTDPDNETEAQIGGQQPRIG
jgi:putative MFS transporter